MALFITQFTVAQINTPSGATIPFGSNTSYEYGIIPTNLPTSGTYKQAQKAAEAYNSWKNKYVSDCNDGSKRVLFDDNSSTVSEGIAYGMLLSAYAADKTTFDALWKFYLNNTNGNGVMNWKLSSCTNTVGYNGATDAELDAAMALIIAEVQWPTATSPYNYENEAKTLISKIRQHEIHPSSYQTVNGDAWGFDNSCRNPSYFSPAYYREFSKLESNQAAFWNSTVTTSNSFLLKNRNSTTGLVSDWADNNGAPSTCNNKPYHYGYDACRNPWRMATDVLWNGKNTATTASDICEKMSAWSNGYAYNLRGPLPMNAANPSVGEWANGTFSTYALAVMGSNSNYQNHLNSCYTAVVNIGNNETYFNATIRTITLFMLTGNFWSPEIKDGDNTNGGDGETNGGDNGNTDGGDGETNGGDSGGTDNGGVSAIGDYEWDSIVTYPNPFSTTLTIEGLEKAVKYTFTDVSGRIIQTGTTNGTLETSFDAGIYNLTLYLNSGEKHIRLLKVD